MLGLCRVVGRATHLRFGAFLHAVQLMTPEALEGPGPLMDGLDRLGVGAVEAMAPIAPHAHQAHTAQHTEVLRDRRLIEPDGYHDLAYVALVRGQIFVQIVPAELTVTRALAIPPV